MVLAEIRGEAVRIIHVGGLSSPHIVDGINTVIWTIAAEQARLGHQVGLLVSEPPDIASYRYARERGIDLLHIPANRWRFDPSVGPALIVEPAADIVHFHSVFIPRQATLARDLRRWGMPYVVTPHGGLMPQVLERGRWKKRAYSSLVEQPRIQMSSGIAYVTPAGEADIRRFVPGFRGPMHWVSNPVDVEQLASVDWNPQGPRPQLTFLGRYDVYHKGLDRLAEIARRVPEADFHLFGVEDPKTKRHLDAMRRSGPANLFVNGPVFGAEKLEALARSTMYIQVSRWEALSISILEALAMGVPTVIAESMSMASMIRENDLGLVVSIHADLAAVQIGQALAATERQRAWSASSRAYARNHFSPRAVAEKVMEVYDEALDYYFSTGTTRIPGALESDRHVLNAPARLFDEHDQKERDSKYLENLLYRRDSGVEKAVDSLSAGDDA